MNYDAAINYNYKFMNTFRHKMQDYKLDSYLSPYFNVFFTFNVCWGTLNCFLIILDQLYETAV